MVRTIYDSVVNSFCCHCCTASQKTCRWPTSRGAKTHGRPKTLIQNLHVTSWYPCRMPLFDWVSTRWCLFVRLVFNAFNFKKVHSKYANNIYCNYRITSDNRDSKYSIRWFQELIGKMKCPIGINIWLYSDFHNKSLSQAFFFFKEIMRLQDKYLTCQRKPNNQTRVFRVKKWTIQWCWSTKQ